MVAAFAPAWLVLQQGMSHMMEEAKRNIYVFSVDGVAASQKKKKKKKKKPARGGFSGRTARDIGFARPPYSSVLQGGLSIPPSHQHCWPRAQAAPRSTRDYPSLCPAEWLTQSGRSEKRGGGRGPLPPHRSRRRPTGSAPPLAAALRSPTPPPPPAAGQWGPAELRFAASSEACH